MNEEAVEARTYTFPQKVWIAGGVFALIIVFMLFLKTAFPILLLVLAGALIGIFFHGLASFIAHKTGMKDGWALLISVLGTVIIIAGLSLLIGYKISSQMAQLTDTLPATLQRAKEQLNHNPLGQKIVAKAEDPKTIAKLKTVAGTFFQTTFGVAGDIYVVLFLGIFFTAAPKPYRKGIIRLVPIRGREKASNVLDKLGGSLKKWIIGKLFAMFVVFVLTAIGLAIIGMPLWLSLALIAGVLNFIPNFGPLLAMIPAVLIALLQGPATAGIVAGLYVLVQVVESNFITPLAQQRLVSIPPALIISAQLIVGTFSGGWGIVLATPLVVIVMILVQELYLKRIEA